MIYEDDNKPSQAVFFWEFLFWWKSLRTNQNGMLLVGFGTNDHLFIYLVQQDSNYQERCVVGKGFL